MAYGLGSGFEGTVAVLDFGGGTFDVTIMDIGEGVFEVLSTAGDSYLGGKDIDDAIVNYLLETFKEQEGVDLFDPAAMQRLKDEAERAKIMLSSTNSTTINLPFIAVVNGEPKHLEVELTRAKLEELAEPVLKRLEPPIWQALKDAKKEPEDIDKIILVGGSTRMPAVRRRFEEILGKKVEGGVDPLQSVAIGAAIQAGILSGKIKKDIVLLDVTPLTLSVETLGGIATPIIERNTTIPVRRSKIFTTAEDNQTSVEIHIVQGERKMAADNISLGRFILDGIPPAPRGVPQIEVTFDIDADGILHVSAKDLGTGKEASIKITGSTRLSQEEIERMVKEAEKYAEEDKRRAEEAELRNKADALAYSSEKTLKQFHDKISADKRENAQRKINELRDLLKQKAEISKIKAKMDELTSIMHEISTEIYQKGGGTTTGAGSTGGTGSGGAGSGAEGTGGSGVE